MQCHQERVPAVSKTRNCYIVWKLTAEDDSRPIVNETRERTLYQPLYVYTQLRSTKDASRFKVTEYRGLFERKTSGHCQANVLCRPKEVHYRETI